MAEASNPSGCDFCGLPLPGEGPQYCSRTCYDLWLVTPVGDEPWRESDIAARKRHQPQYRCSYCGCTVAYHRDHETEGLGCHCGTCIFSQGHFDRLVGEKASEEDAGDGST